LILAPPSKLVVNGDGLGSGEAQVAATGQQAECGHGVLASGRQLPTKLRETRLELRLIANRREIRIGFAFQAGECLNSHRPTAISVDTIIVAISGRFVTYM
jgi:hypothetical protein